MITRFRISSLAMNTGQIAGLPKNPRSWTQSDIDRLAKSIEETPELLDARPLIVFKQGNKFIVLGGNLRLSAIKKLGWQDAPVYLLPQDTPIEKLKEIVIKDNGSFGKWDYDMLANEWDDLPLPEWGVPAWDGSSSNDLEVKIEPNGAQEDNFDQDNESISVICKRGDIWQLGEHRLMCGYSIDLEEVKKLMGGGKIDLLLTDPPYNVDVQNSKGDKIMNDNMDSQSFDQFLARSFRCADAVMRPGSVFYIWHAETTGAQFRNAAEKVGWQIRQCLIWNKNHFILGRQDYQWKHEPCLYGWKDGASHYFFDSRCESTVIEDEHIDIKKLKKDELLKLLADIFAERRSTTTMDFDKPSVDADHPTMKPVKLIGYLMRNSSKPGDSVLDLFGGSGTTLIAAEQLGRKCYMMELDPHYCDVIIARWEKLTGKTAIKT